MHRLISTTTPHLNPIPFPSQGFALLSIWWHCVISYTMYGWLVLKVRGSGDWPSIRPWRWMNAFVRLRVCLPACLPACPACSTDRIAANLCAHTLHPPLTPYTTVPRHAPSQNAARLVGGGRGAHHGLPGPPLLPLSRPLARPLPLQHPLPPRARPLEPRRLAPLVLSHLPDPAGYVARGRLGMDGWMDA